VGRAEKKAAKAAKKAGRRKRRGGFLFGAVVGAVAGLLLAPKSGKETRQQLLGEGGFGAQVDRIKGAVGAGKDSAVDQSEDLRRKIEETRERLRGQVDAGGNGVGGEDAFAGPADTAAGE
jgi:gas vesicle protein